MAIQDAGSEPVHGRPLFAVAPFSRGVVVLRPAPIRLTLLLLPLWLVSVGCSDNPKTAQTSRPDSVRTTAEASPETAGTSPPTGTVSATSGTTKSTTWTYENRVEAAGESVTHRASLTSPTRLEFGFPYAGGSTVRLGLRERNGDALVSLHVTNGAFNRSFQEGSVRIRFDGRSPVTYRYAPAQNGSATVIFLDQPDAIIRQLKSSRTAVVNLDFYNQGNRQFTFNTATLRWPY